jgi:hypothetical protein
VRVTLHNMRNTMKLRTLALAAAGDPFFKQGAGK